MLWFNPWKFPTCYLSTLRRFAMPRGEFCNCAGNGLIGAQGVVAQLVQDNLSVSDRHVPRGPHCQLALTARAKLIVALAADIRNVAVVSLRSSATHGRSVAVRLCAEAVAQNICLLAEFAHGLCVLIDSADVLYKLRAEYRPELERGIRCNDPTLNVNCSIALPIVNERDAQLPR